VSVCRSSVGVFSALIILGSTHCGEDKHTEYASYKILASSGAGPRSWFPRCTPTSAFQLEEFHNVDDNVVIGRFRIPLSDVGLMADCGSAPGKIAADLDPVLSGWPTCLTGHITDQTLKQCDMVAYDDSQFIIAADARTGNVFYWSR